eukprot:9591923-Ditylum_brightwellii.AAC.1
MKEAHSRTFHHRPLTNTDNFILASISSAISVCIMMPMDTIKTRLVVQSSSQLPPRPPSSQSFSSVVCRPPPKGIRDCAARVMEEE